MVKLSALSFSLPFKMPRRSSSSWDDRRAEDRYWDYIYDNCLCRWYEAEDGTWHQDEEDPCTHCRWETKKAARAARDAAEEAARAAAKEEEFKKNPHYHEIVTLRGFLFHHPSLPREKRVENVRGLLEALLGFESFLAKQKKFREVLVGKLAEFRAEPDAAPLLELFDQVEALIKRLPEVEGYVA